MRRTYISSQTKKIIQEALKIPAFRGALRQGSVSQTVAQERLRNLAIALDNALANQNGYRMFSTTNVPAFGTVLGVSSLLAMVTSFSGALTLERAVEQPRIVQYFMDIVGTNLDAATGEPITSFPVVGPTRYSDQNVSMFRENYTINLNNTNTFNPTLPYPIIPGTLKITFTFVDNNGNIQESFEVRDDRRGNLLIPSSYSSRIGAVSLAYGGFSPTLSPATLSVQFINIPNNYATLRVTLEHNYGFVEEPTMPTAGNDTRLQLSMARTVLVDTKPSLLTIQMSLIELAHVQKSMGIDVASYLTQKITEIYTKVINRYIVQAYLTNFVNEREVVIDLSAPITPYQGVSQYNAFTPILDKLVAQMEEVNNELAKKSFIGLKATAYLVSPRLAYWIRRTKILDPSAFVEENAPYINDLIGYWYGVPVFVHTDLGQFDTKYTDNNGNEFYTAKGFAVHVRSDASLAPILHAIFLPATQTPTTGNFFNPTQQAISLYYQVDNAPLARELVVPFVVRGLPVA